MPYNEDNWNSYGAKRTNPVIAYKLLQLLKEILPLNCPIPWIVPCTLYGGLEATWLNDEPEHDIDLAINYFSDNQILMYFTGVEDDIPFRKDLAIDIINTIIIMKEK